jgi:hypothetical protein
MISFKPLPPLLQGKQPSLPIAYEAWWVPQTVWMLWRREKYLTLATNRILILLSPASSLLTILTELPCSIQQSVLPVFSDCVAATKSFTFREESSGVLFVLLPPEFTLLNASRNVFQMMRNCEPLSLIP